MHESQGWTQASWERRNSNKKRQRHPGGGHCGSGGVSLWVRTHLPPKVAQVVSEKQGHCCASSTDLSTDLSICTLFFHQRQRPARAGRALSCLLSREAEHQVALKIQAAGWIKVESGIWSCRVPASSLSRPCPRILLGGWPTANNGRLDQDAQQWGAAHSPPLWPVNELLSNSQVDKVDVTPKANWILPPKRCKRY